MTITSIAMTLILRFFIWKEDYSYIQCLERVPAELNIVQYVLYERVHETGFAGGGQFHSFTMPVERLAARKA